MRKFPNCFLCGSRVLYSPVSDFMNGEIAHFHARCWERWRNGEEPKE